MAWTLAKLVVTPKTALNASAAAPFFAPAAAAAALAVAQASTAALLALHLLTKVYQTSESQSEIVAEGWRRKIETHVADELSDDGRVLSTAVGELLEVVGDERGLLAVLNACAELDGRIGARAEVDAGSRSCSHRRSGGGDTGRGNVGHNRSGSSIGRRRSFSRGRSGGVSSD